MNRKTSGFSMVEALAVVSILGILALIMIPIAASLRPAAQETQTQISVSQINSAIKAYLSNGGTLDGVDSVDTVLVRLKSKMDNASANTFVGFSGAAIDQRLKAMPVSAEETGPRAVYDEATKKFEVTNNQVAGVRFELDENYEGNGVAATEVREGGIFEYANAGTWVWDYTDAPKSSPLDVTEVTQTPVTSPIPVGLLGTSSPEGPETPELRKLLPPGFSITSGSYQVGDFPMVLEISNPNEAGKIMYGIVSDGSWGWSEYSDPIVVTPGMQVVAFVDSWRPQQYHNSNITSALYDWNAKLSSPWFSVSDTMISQTDGATTITLNHNNDPAYYAASGLIMPANPFEIRYRIVPTVAGSGAETGWLNYSTPFQVAGMDYPEGFEVYAKVVSNIAKINESWVANTSISTFDPDDVMEEEIEFTTTDITLNIGDSFNIRDFVQVKGDPSAEIDWSQVYFTYTDGGANNPTNPYNWNLGAFQSGSTVTVTDADIGPGLGNGTTDGEYTVYLVRTGQTAYDTSMTIRVVDPTEGLPSLLPPVFDKDSGYYENSDFPLTITLTDPNPAGVGKIVYTVNGSTSDYAGPFSVDPDTTVTAYVEALDPTEHKDSGNKTKYYRLSSTPSGPWIWLSDHDIEASSGSTNIYMGYNNTSHVDWEVQYKLIPTVPGEGTETDWATYSGGVSIGAPQFPRGFDVVAKIVASDPLLGEVEGETETVTVYYQLQQPQIASDVDSITSEAPLATITLTNPNPPGSSSLSYQIRDSEGSSATGWQVYNTPFVIDGNDYPDGVTIVAKATPDDSYYRESGEASKSISASFYDTELTFKTIFVLDTSGSMSTNNRLQRLKTQFAQAMALFNDESSFAVIEYSDGASVLLPWGNASASRKSSAIAAVNSMTADGATNYHDALGAVLSLGSTEATQVIFLSDGLPFRPDEPDPESTDGILDLVDQIVATSIERLDVIALGIDSQILADMATRGNGTQATVSDE